MVLLVQERAPKVEAKSKIDFNLRQYWPTVLPLRWLASLHCRSSSPVERRACHARPDSALYASKRNDLHLSSGVLLRHSTSLWQTSTKAF
jgi:hypothetical protein